MWSRGLLMPTSPPTAAGGGRPYTPAMRRWVCIIGLLAGFASADPGRTARTRDPVAIERSLASFRAIDPAALPTTADWWIRP